MNRLTQLYNNLTSPNAFIWILGFIFAANAVDGLLTVIWLEHKVAWEANPLMAWLYDYSPGLFLFLKIAIVFLALLGLYRVSHRELARVLIWPVFCVYAYVLMWHIIGVADVVAQLR